MICKLMRLFRVLAVLPAIAIVVVELKRRIDKMSKEQDDLVAATAALVQVLPTALTLIQTELAVIRSQTTPAPGVDPAVVEASAQSINNVVSQISAAVAAAQAQLPASSAVPPASTTAPAPVVPAPQPDA